MQVMYLGRAPRTKETLPDFLKWCRVTRPHLVFRGLTGSQRTPGFWGVTLVVLFILEVDPTTRLGYDFINFLGLNFMGCFLKNKNIWFLYTAQS